MLENQITIWEWLEEINKDMKLNKYDVFRDSKTFTVSDLEKTLGKMSLKDFDGVMVNGLYLVTDSVEFKKDKYSTNGFIDIDFYSDGHFCASITVTDIEVLNIIVSYSKNAYDAFIIFKVQEVNHD